MFKTGVLGFGGGPSVIPLIRHEAVKTYNWIDNDEFGEILALANALPGPIATKMAAYLGYRKRGTLGATVAVLSHILPSALAMIALMSVVQYLSGSQIVQGMIAGVIPVVAVMLGVMAYEFGEKAIKGLGAKLGIVLFVAAFALLQLLDVHDAIVIALFLAYGAFHFKIVRKLRERKQPKETSGG
ncbi:chromate transporter [Cohnella thailandensis]|uniref:Chromate transporter n=2 Tax=Cohnella thailandensis TaxID=557557 RepID=A0A841T1L8_9BACL|nr:chromate transporter [Cohnella thailandensis]